MKKLILTFFGIGMAIFTYGQTCNVGKTPNGFFDNFSSAEPPSNPDHSGIYEWDDVPAGRSTRNASAGRLDVIATQAYGAWEPYGISFGDSEGDGTGTPHFINLSSDKTFSVKVHNHHSSISIRFRMVIQDDAGKIIDTYASAGSADFGDAWQHMIEVVVPAGQTRTLSGTYAGGYHSDYDQGAFTTGLNFAKVSSVMFFVTNEEQNPTDGWKHTGFTDLHYSIDDIRVGACNLVAEYCTAGIGDGVVFEDFSSAEEIFYEDNSGLFMWTAQPATTWTRNTVNKRLDVVATQAYGAFQPFGIAFGTENPDGSGALHTVNLSANKNFSVKVKNNHSSITIKFRMAIQDANGKIIDTYASAGSTTFANAWQHVIEMSVAPGETKTLSGTYEGGYYADYNAGALVQGFDFTKVATVLFTVINSAQNASDNWNHMGFSNLSMNIMDVKLGQCPTSCLTPDAPSSIAGPSTSCPNASGREFSIPFAKRASSYQWVVTGGTITEGQGSRSIKVTWGTTAGTVSVRPVNSCGNGALEERNITISSNCSIPAEKTISGPSSVNQGQTGVTYSVSPAPDGSVYSWTLPAGAEITASNADMSTITVSFGTSGGEIKLTETNDFGSTESVLAVIVNEPTSANRGFDLSIGLNPNPTTGQIYLSNNSGVNSTYHVMVKNLVGETLISKQIQLENGAIFNFDISDNLPGLYLFEVESVGGRTVKRILKQ
ncbi:MAG: T9SS type A sorting domain-containing protein [Cytophagaceae bacterium]